MGSSSTGPTVLAFMTSNGDRPITLDELEQNISLRRDQISNAMGNLLRSERYVNLEQVQRGVWRWNSNPLKPVKASQRTEFLASVVIVKEDGSMLVRDTEGDLYAVRRFDF